MRPTTTTLLFPERRRSGRGCRPRGRPRLQTRETGFGAPTDAAQSRCHRVLPHRYARKRPMIMPDLGDIIGYAHWEIEPRADPCLLPSLPISRLPPDPDRDGSAWWPPFRSASVEWWERGFFRSSASWRTPPAMPCGWHLLSAESWRSYPPIRTPSSAPRFPQPAAPCISW